MFSKSKNSVYQFFFSQEKKKLTGALGVASQSLLARLYAHSIICLKYRKSITTPEISTVPCDISLPHLSLGQTKLKDILKYIDCIVHSAAVTDFGQSDGVNISDTFSTITVETLLGQSITPFDPGMNITVATPAVNVEAAKSVNVNAGRFVNIKAGGFVNLTAGGMILAKSAGPISLASTSAISLQAPTIALAAPVILCGGDPVPTPGPANALASSITPTTQPQPPPPAPQLLLRSHQGLRSRPQSRVQPNP